MVWQQGSLFKKKVLVLLGTIAIVSLLLGYFASSFGQIGRIMVLAVIIGGFITWAGLEAIEVEPRAMAKFDEAKFDEAKFRAFNRRGSLICAVTLAGILIVIETRIVVLVVAGAVAGVVDRHGQDGKAPGTGARIGALAGAGAVIGASGVAGTLLGLRVVEFLPMNVAGAGTAAGAVIGVGVVELTSREDGYLPKADTRSGAVVWAVFGVVAGAIAMAMMGGILIVAVMAGAVGVVAGVTSRKEAGNATLAWIGAVIGAVAWAVGSGAGTEVGVVVVDAVVGGFQGMLAGMLTLFVLAAVVFIVQAIVPLLALATRNLIEALPKNRYYKLSNFPVLLITTYLGLDLGWLLEQFFPLGK